MKQIVTPNSWKTGLLPDAQARQRILGCLYGGAAGDALGYGVEFLSLEQIRAKYGHSGIGYYDLVEGVAPFSDDTQMLLFTMEGVFLWDRTRRTEPGVKLKNCLFAVYRDWLYTQEREGPRKDSHKARTRLYRNPELHHQRAPGFTCMRSLRSKRMGSIGQPVNDSKANGGVMRAAPIGFLFPRGEWFLEEVVRMGAESAALTHGHPLGYISTGMMAGLVNECVYGRSETLKEAVLLALRVTDEVFASFSETEGLHELIEKAISLAAHEQEDVEAIAQFGNSACAESTMAIAVYCALKYEHDFEKAIIAAVNFDGDSDTVAAVTGNILGAWRGLGCIDRKWIEPLQLETYLNAFDFYG